VAITRGGATGTEFRTAAIGISSRIENDGIIGLTPASSRAIFPVGRVA
jgi:hypothetical protein